MIFIGFSGKSTLLASSSVTEKNRLRATALARRDALPQKARAIASAAICTQLSGLIPEKAILAAYLPMRSEVDLSPLIARLHDEGRMLTLPAITGEALIFRRHEPGMPLVAQAFGTRAPGEQAPSLTPDVILLPLAAFDRALHRLGYGRAYYDRTLAALHAHGIRPLLIGAAFALQEVESIPAEAHDIALDAVVTEREIIGTPKGVATMGERNAASFHR